MNGQHTYSELTPALVALEARRWGHDLGASNIGRQVLLLADQVGPIPPAELQAAQPQMPGDGLEEELSTLDVLSRGDFASEARDRVMLEVAKLLRVRTAIVASRLKQARQKLGVTSNIWAVRACLELGLLDLLPTQEYKAEDYRPLSTGRFIMLSLSSRGWETRDYLAAFGGAPNTPPTIYKQAREALGRAQTPEQAGRRALSFGGLSLDRTLIF